jgi:gluconolactonase
VKRRSGNRARIGSPALRWLTVHATLPAALRRPRRSRWADINLAGREVGCFLEGPDFDAAGNLYVVDIPFGRIFRLDAHRRWHTLIEYDGWPNGLKVEPAGTLLVADHKLGLLRVDPAAGTYKVLLDQIAGTPLHGLNDLTFGTDGALYITDQGQTGLHDPCGRLLRLGSGAEVEILLANVPSPNGLVFDRNNARLYLAATRANAIWRVPLVEGRPSKVGLAIQLSGGIGPDGLALDPQGRLLAAHPPLGIWHFDADNLPAVLYRSRDPSYVTNLVLRARGRRTRLFATDSIAGRILTAEVSI